MSAALFPIQSNFSITSFSGSWRVEWNQDFAPDVWYVEVNSWSGSDWVFVDIYSFVGTQEFYQSTQGDSVAARFRFTAKVGDKFSAPTVWHEIWP